MQITKLFIPLAIMAGAVQAIARPEVVKLSDLETQAKAAPATPPNSPNPGKARDVVEDNE